MRMYNKNKLKLLNVTYNIGLIFIMCYIIINLQDNY
jgi:hypothetical protein